MTVSKDIISANDSIIIKLPSGNQKILTINSGSVVDLGKFGKFKSDELIGQLYSCQYEIYDRDRIKRLPIGNYLDSFSISIQPQLTYLDINPKEETEATNQEMLDDSKTQKLSRVEIEEMKSKSLEGSIDHHTIIKTLVSNNENFDSKTEFSKAKYIKRKVEKFSKTFTPLQTTAKNLVEYWREKNIDKIRELRIDTLSQMLTLINVRSGSRLLVVDDTGGLIGTALLERTHGVGELVFIHDGPNADLHMMKAGMWASKVNDSCFPCKWSSIGKPVECVMNSDDPVHIERAKVGTARAEKVYEMFQSKSFEGLIVASKFKAKDVIEKLAPYLRSSSPVVVYDPRKEMLMDALLHVQKTKEFINTQLTESWIREYQVPIFSSGTHPMMMTSGGGGFILSCTTVDEDGVVLNKPTFKNVRANNKRLKTDKE
ncbi:Gcd10p family-domain-containing protein [Globomyces pollinis-pini]|nr:Gcd10p family-domain-containing protein [Globomyces pollinis-pini]